MVQRSETAPRGDDANWPSLIATALVTALFVLIPAIIAIKGPSRSPGTRAPFAHLPWRLAPFVAIAFAPVLGGLAILLRRPVLARLGVGGAILIGIASWVLLLR